MIIQKIDDSIIRLREATEEGEEITTKKYLVRHELLALILFTVSVLISQIWFNVLESGIKEYFKKDALTFKDWLLLGVTFTVTLWIVARYIIKIPLTATFGF